MKFDRRLTTDKIRKISSLAVQVPTFKQSKLTFQEKLQECVNRLQCHTDTSTTESTMDTESHTVHTSMQGVCTTSPVVMDGDSSPFLAARAHSALHDDVTSVTGAFNHVSIN